LFRPNWADAVLTPSGICEWVFPLGERLESVPTGGAPRAQDTELLNQRVMSRRFISRCLAPRWPTDFILLTLRRYLDSISPLGGGQPGSVLEVTLPACSHCLTSEVASDGLSHILESESFAHLPCQPCRQSSNLHVYVGEVRQRRPPPHLHYGAIRGSTELQGHGTTCTGTMR
jgi:hypothetical protein